MKVLKSSDGKLYQVEDNQVETLKRDQGMVEASPDELAASEAERTQHAQYGGLGQQTLGLAETFVRNATLGAVTGLSGTEEEQRARALETQEESPILDFAAGAAPAVAAGVAAAPLTGGASIPALLATEGAIGGLGGLGAAQDEAFRHDQELSAEAALGSFAQGALIGAGTAGVLAGGGKILGAARNRFVEASGKAARAAEKEAFEAAGIMRPVEGLGQAAEDPVKRAAIREAGEKARPAAAKSLESELRAMEESEQAIRARPPATEVTGDVAPQRNAVSYVIKSARDDLAPVAPELSGKMERVLEALDAADEPGAVYSVAKGTRAALDDMLQDAETPEIAKVIQTHLKRAEKLEADDSLFGAAGAETGEAQRVLSDLEDARTALREALNEGDYLAKAGTLDGEPVEQALDTYMTRLGQALEAQPENEVAKNGLAAIARTRSLQNAELRAVAGGNQARLLGGPKRGVDLANDMFSGMARDMMGELAETAIEQIVPGAGLIRKAFKYRKHIARLVGMARGQARETAEKLIDSSMAQRASSGAKTPRALRSGITPLGSRAIGFLGSGDMPAEYSRVKNSIQMLVKEPDKLSESLAQQMGDIPSEAPELMEAVSAKASRIVDFMASKLPPAFSFSILYPDGPPPSRTDMMEVGLYWNGATNPTDVLKAIGDGTAMPEEVEAFRVANPTWFAELQESAHEIIAQKAQSGDVIPCFKLTQLETLLDLPGKLDPTFSDDVAKVAQQRKAEQKQEQQAPSYVPQPKAGERTKVEHTETMT